jgi:hypothetical protein
VDNLVSAKKGGRKNISRQISLNKNVKRQELLFLLKESHQVATELKIARFGGNDKVK